MEKHRTLLVLVAVAMVIALVSYLLLREPSGPVVDAKSGSAGGLLLIVIIALAISSGKKRDPNSPN